MTLFDTATNRKTLNTGGDFRFASRVVPPQQPFEILKGTAPIILSFPHAGTYLPPDFKLPSEWKEPLGRHEVHDIGTPKLLEELQKHLPHVTFISTEWSRLWFDANRKRSKAIAYSSCDTGETIPGNAELSFTQKQERFKMHDTYMAAQNMIIQTALNQYNGRVAFLDIHSFAREHDGKIRNAAMGTLRHSETGFSKLVERIAAPQLINLGDGFQHDKPYDLKGRQERNIIDELVELLGDGYLGLEIQQELLTNPAHFPLFVSLIKDVVQKIEADFVPNFKVIETEVCSKL